MAITKLMHMKESPDWKPKHLWNAIRYILDPNKTDNSRLAGGNSGKKPKEVLDNFLETKEAFQKPDGRQGYHFVISFAPGETDEATTYEVIREFCEEYLGDDYDYVFAVHNDTAHKHGHIIFNSVSRIDGHKYHYKKGDWEKFIQPITDRICAKHNLAPLTFATERVGTSYASWAAAKEGKYNWSHIIRADVDFAIQQSGSFEEFQKILQKMNYKLRFGTSKKHGDYITFVFISEDGKEHKRRSYNLPTGYSKEEIVQRIKTKEGSRSYEEIMRSLEGKTTGYLKSGISKSMRTYARLYQAASYYKLPNPYAVPAHRVRKDMLRIDRLLEECRYLKDNQIKNRESVEKRFAHLAKEQERLSAERKALYQLRAQVGEEQLAAMEKYGELQKAMMLSEREGSDQFEEIEEQMAEMEKLFPHDLLELKDRIEAYGKELAGTRKEMRILKRILETERDRKQPVQEPRI